MAATALSTWTAPRYADEPGVASNVWAPTEGPVTQSLAEAVQHGNRLFEMDVYRWNVEDEGWEDTPERMPDDVPLALR